MRVDCPDDTAGDHPSGGYAHQASAERRAILASCCAQGRGILIRSFDVDGASEADGGEVVRR
jgi:hypothetical protein